MKYCWRWGNTTYFEDRRFEGTVIFDGRIKPHFAKVKIALAILPIWRYAHRCLVNAVLAPLKHTQHRHIFWTFPLIHKTHKTLIEIINSIEQHTFFFFHQTTVSVTPNAFQPLFFWASPCSFGCSGATLHLNTKKSVNIPWGIIEKSWKRKKRRFQNRRHL